MHDWYNYHAQCTCTPITELGFEQGLLQIRHCGFLFWYSKANRFELILESFITADSAMIINSVSVLLMPSKQSLPVVCQQRREVTKHSLVKVAKSHRAAGLIVLINAKVNTITT